MNTIRLQRGFTLVEMVMVIVITGIIAGMVAVFLRAPVEQYMDVARRAEMTDIADTALRRIARDLRGALPNSVRLTGACSGATDCTLEFMPTVGGGRYRAQGGNDLAFHQADTSFEVLGPMPPATTGHHIVVYNLGINDADAYSGSAAATDVRRPISGVDAANRIISITSNQPLPFDSPSHRFHVVSTPVRYVCAANAANPALRTLTRVSDYGWPPGSTGAGTPSLLAQHVSSCRFNYDQNIVGQRAGLVTLQLSITDDGETVSLYHAVHVSNQP
jgi:MSHA biogenesis protein MshO